MNQLSTQQWFLEKLSHCSNIQCHSSLETTLLCEEWYGLSTGKNSFCNLKNNLSYEWGLFYAQPNCFYPHGYKIFFLISSDIFDRSIVYLFFLNCYSFQHILCGLKSISGYLKIKSDYTGTLFQTFSLTLSFCPEIELVLLTYLDPIVWSVWNCYWVLFLLTHWISCVLNAFYVKARVALHVLSKMYHVPGRVICA